MKRSIHDLTTKEWIALILLVVFFAIWALMSATGP